MHLQTQTPLWMGEAIINSEPSVVLEVSIVKWLDEEVFEIKMFKAFRIKAVLWEKELQFLARPDLEICSWLGTNTDPVDTGKGC